MIKCARCQEHVPDNEKFDYYDQVLCEDCYIGAIEPPRSCDVTAVNSAKRARALAGQTGTDGLTDLQKDLYNYIKKEGKATKPVLAQKFRLAEWELDKQIAILRHCELVKGRKDGDKIYIVPFEA